jgi:DNA-binding transcriptional MerR regulator
MEMAARWAVAQGIRGKQMEDTSTRANIIDRDEVTLALTSLQEGIERPSSSRRTVGERRLGRNAKLVSSVAERLSKVMSFGRLQEADLYTIGELSDYLQVSLRTLRFYEQAGLLRPQREGLKRLYTREDLDRLQVIVTLREMEASLTAIKGLMTTIADAGDEARMIAEIRRLLDTLAEGNRERIAELERVNRRIGETIRCLSA